MSRYNLEDLLSKWKKEEMTAEQAIGQLVQWLRTFDNRLRSLENIHPDSSLVEDKPPTTHKSKTR